MTKDTHTPAARMAALSLSLILAVSLACQLPGAAAPAEPTAAATQAGAATDAPALTQPPAPTQAPGAEPTVTSAPSGEATAAPDPTPTTQVSAGGNDTQDYSPQTACDHPYFPLRLDAEWHFESDQGDYTWTVTEVTGDLQSAEAVVVVEYDGVTVTYHWSCDADGLVSYDFGNLAIGDQGNVDYEVLEAEGVWLPPADQIQPGATWQRDYSVLYDFDLGVITTEATAAITETFTVSPTQRVIVPAGEFDALPVELFGEIAIVIAGGGTPEIEATVVYYLAHGVGVVRQESMALDMVNTSLLARYEMP